MADLTPIRPFLWFDGRAQEAMDYYVSVFPNSSVDAVAHYPDESLDRHFRGMGGKVINGEFTLNGMPFGCLDGGPEFTFNESVSFSSRARTRPRSITTGRRCRPFRSRRPAAGARTASASAGRSSPPDWICCSNGRSRSRRSCT